MFLKLSHLIALTLTAIQNVESFQAMQTTMPTTRSLALLAKSRVMAEIPEDEEGAKRILVKNIAREWTYTDEKTGEEYIAEGEFSVDAFIPDGKVKGCAFFMHGFSQYPIAYRETLTQAADKANIAIIACETGLTSSIVLKDVASKPLSFITDRTWPQFALQRALSEDTKQCVNMVLANDPAFKEYGITKNLPLAVCGHSMGGGLCFTVAKHFTEIQHVFAMAPAAGVDAFDPKSAIRERTAKNSMLLAGDWDLLAKADKVAAMSAEANKKSSDSSILVDVGRGLHTGFQDRLVLFSIPILKGLGILSIVFNVLGFVEIAILRVLAFFRTSTGQLDGTRALMDYFFEQMATKKQVTIEGAMASVADAVPDKWEDKFDIKYGGK
jgi:hypothetical protein